MAWWRDFKWSARGVQASESGAAVSWGFVLFKALPVGLPYLVAMIFRNMGRPKSCRIAFLPERPRPWHSIWSVSTQAGGEVIETAEDADAVFFFDETTRSKPPHRPDPLIPDFNFRCVDTSKSRVARDFHIIFGYPLAVAPERHKGPIVMKSQINGRQDGRIIEGPALPEPGFAYQKLIDNQINGKQVEIFSCPAVRGEIPLVYVCRRRLKRRFSNRDKTVFIANPSAVFHTEELLRIRYFCAAIGLDWGTIDILRDNTDGRIYIVDVNKTDIGPPLALPLQEKFRATDILAESLSMAVSTADNLSERAEPPIALAS